MRMMGIEPLVVVKLTYEGVATYFSTQEIEDFLGEPVHGLIQSFGSFSSVGDTSGFGSVGSISVTCNDYTGFFKDWLETRNLYDCTAELFFLIRQPPAEDIALQFFIGRVSGPINWSEGERICKFDIVSGVEFEEFGFTPQFEFTEYIRSNLTNNPWPHMFGNVENFGLLPMTEVPEAKTVHDFIFLYPMSPREVANPSPPPDTLDIDGGYPGYADTPSTKYIGETPLIGIQCSDFARLPPDIGLYFSLEIDGGSVLFRGTHTGSGLIGVSQWNINWYESIVCFSPPQYNVTLPYQSDNEEYIPNTVEMLGYGTVLPVESWAFNIYDELIGAVNITTPFPPDDSWFGDLTNWNTNKNTPWLKDMYIKFQAYTVKTDEEGEPEALTVTLWAKVIDQYNLTLYLDEIQDLNGQEFSLSGLRVQYIFEARKNKIFQANSTDLEDFPNVRTQGSQAHKMILLDRGDIDPAEAGIKDPGFLIPAESTIRTVDWWGNRTYVVSLDKETDITEIFYQAGTSLQQLDFFSQYAVMRYDKYAVNKWEWYRPIGPVGTWIPATPATSPLPASMQIIDDEEWPDEFVFVLLYQGAFLQFLQDVAGTEYSTIRVYCNNIYNTDEKVFRYLLEKYTTYVGAENPDSTRHLPLNMGLQESGSIQDILTRLAWEHAKQIRIALNMVNLEDLLNPDRTQRFNFTEKYIEAKTFFISYTEDNLITNYIKATAANNWSSGTFNIRNTESISRHTERIDTKEILFNRVLDTYTPGALDPGDPENTGWVSGAPGYIPRGYNRVLYYWLYKQANIWMRVAFNTFLEAIGLVANDYVNVNLTQPLVFSDPDAQGVLQYPLGGSGAEALPNAKGRLLEINIDLNTWTISAVVELPIKLGEER